MKLQKDVSDLHANSAIPLRKPKYFCIAEVNFVDSINKLIALSGKKGSTQARF